MALLTFSLAATYWLSSAELLHERILGPEVPGKYKHPAAIEELKGGDLFLVWHGGAGEYEEDTRVEASRLPAGSTRWEKPFVVADTPFHGDGNAVIWQAPDDAVWLFYVVRYGETWASSRICAKVSRDGARTWSDSFVLAMESGMMVRNRPVVLSSGDWLVPIYHEVGTDKEDVSADCTSLFLRYEPKAKRWSESPRIRSRLGCIQPGVAEVARDHLVAYMRRGGDYNGRPDGWMVRSESRDGGKTWSRGDDSRFPNPNAAIDFLRLKDGSLLLVYNDSFSDRTPLAAALSVDGDKSYPHKRNIAEGKDDFAYPFVIQARDGKVHVVYTANERTEIHRAVFDPAWVREGGK